MKWWNRLSVRLTVLILLLAIVPLVGFGIITIKDILHVRLQSVATYHREIARNSAKLIQSSLASIANEIQLVVESTELESADQTDQEWFLQMLITSSPNIDNLILAERSGRTLVRVGRERVYQQNDLGSESNHSELIKSIDRQAIVGELHKGDNNLLLVDIYVPLLNPMDRQVQAVLIAEIDMGKSLDFITDLRVGETGYVYVVNAEGKYIEHPDHSIVLAGEDALYNPQVRNFVAGSKQLDTNERYLNRYQKEVVSNAYEVTGPRLLVVAVQPVDEALAAVTRTSKRQILVLSIVLLIAIISALYFTIKIVKPLRLLETGAQRIGKGILSHRIPVKSSDELGLVTQSFNTMTDDLEAKSKHVKQQSWLKQGVAELDNLLRGDQSLQDICTHVVTFMASYLQQQAGLIYSHDSQGICTYQAGYAFQPGAGFLETFKLGEGLLGQAALTRKILDITDVPPDYITITSGLGSMVPKQLTIVPFVFNNRVEAVMELGALHQLT